MIHPKPRNYYLYLNYDKMQQLLYFFSIGNYQDKTIFCIIYVNTICDYFLNSFYIIVILNFFGFKFEFIILMSIDCFIFVVSYYVTTGHTMRFVFYKIYPTYGVMELSNSLISN